MTRVRRIFGCFLSTLLIGEIALFCQIGQYPGGQYPGGRYPGGGSPGGLGIPMPGRKQQKKTTTSKTADEQLTVIAGNLRTLDEKQVVIEARDTRIINLKRTPDTKFLKDGEPVKPSDLKPGDHLQIDATQDKEGFFYAVNVVFQKRGSAAERAQASQPVEVSTQAAREGPDTDDERPRLRRADSPRPDAVEPTAPEPAAASTENAPVRRATAAPSEPPVPAPPDPDDPGPPTLRRGVPARRASSATTEIASATAPAASPAPVDTPAPIAREPAAPQPEAPPEDPLIEKAREVADSFTETLPNYVCQQFTARFVNTSHVTNWQAQDVVSAEVVYENGQESYRNLAINGKPIKKNMEELSGAWSKGEFGTLLRDVFSQSSAAKFRFRRNSTIAGMAAAVYDFQVERENSHWRVQVASQSVFPAYKGSVWIDKKNARVLRIEMQARNIPSEFPLDTVESSADYEYVRIGGGTQQFLLPVHSESLSCQRGTNTCSRNVIDFRNYKKYSGEATIIFDK